MAQSEAGEHLANTPETDSQSGSLAKPEQTEESSSMKYQQRVCLCEEEHSYEKVFLS